MKNNTSFKVGGREQMYCFHAETGVPQISCGLGGIMHPCHTLWEAELLPIGPEIPVYVEMIDTIMPAIRSQIEESDKYADVALMYSYIEKEILAFRNRLVNNEEHPGYLENYI